MNNRHYEEQQASLNGFKRDTQETYSEPEKQPDYDDEEEEEDEGSMDGSEFNSDNDPYLDGREEDENKNSQNQNNQGYQQAHQRLGDILDSDDNEESQGDEDNEEEIDSSPEKTSKYRQQQQQYQSKQLNGYSNSSNTGKNSKQYATKQAQMQQTQYQNSQYENQQRQVNSLNQPIQAYKHQQQQNGTKYSQQNSYAGTQQQQQQLQQRHQQQQQQQQQQLQKKPTAATTKTAPQQRDSREYNSYKSIIEPTTTTFPSTRKVSLESGVPLGFSIHPFGLPSQDSKNKGVTVGFKKKKDHSIPTLDEEDISRCTSCGTIVNPFCEIIVSLSKWKCNMCFNVMTFPRVYKEALPNVRAMRQELQCGSYDVILPDKYRARRDEYQVFWFMLDVSESATASGILKSSCETIKNALASESLQCLKNSQSSYAQIGIIGYDHELHLYKINSKTGRGQLFISKDLEEQLDLPSLDTLRILEEKAKENNNNNGSSAGLLSKLSEKISLLQQNQKFSSQPIEPSQQPLIEYDLPFPGDVFMPFNSTASEQAILSLLDSLETMYADRYSKKQQEFQQQPTKNSTANTASPPTSIFLKALDFSLENLKFTGGRLFVFHGRDTILQPANGIDYTAYSISSKLKDTFISISICYVDFPGLPSKLSAVLKDGVKSTNGVMLQAQENQIHSGYYTSYMTKVMSSAYAWNSVVRFRCTKGWSIANVIGNIQLRSNTCNLFNFNATTSQANLLVEVQNELVKNEINYFCLQSCVMFTNENQERIMRVHNYILPLTSNYADLYRGINHKVLAMHIAKKQLDLILSSKVSEREAEQTLINMLKRFVQKMLQNNRSSLTETAESAIMTVLGYLKQKSLIACTKYILRSIKREGEVPDQQTLSKSSHSLMGPLIELLAMGSDEFESMCTPLIFDVEELLQNLTKSPENSKNHSQHNNKSQQFCFPSLIHPSYISIHSKSILLVDFGQESILFVNSKNVTSEILMQIFETDDLNYIASITQVFTNIIDFFNHSYVKATRDQFFECINPNVAQIKLLLANIQHLKKQKIMNSFSIVISDTQNTKEFMLYYKLIMDKYEYFEGAYDNSYDDMIDVLLKPL